MPTGGAGASGLAGIDVFSGSGPVFSLGGEGLGLWSTPVSFPVRTVLSFEVSFSIRSTSTGRAWL